MEFYSAIKKRFQFKTGANGSESQVSDRIYIQYIL
jgi:hypothetical protein